LSTYSRPLQKYILDLLGRFWASETTLEVKNRGIDISPEVKLGGIYISFVNSYWNYYTLPEVKLGVSLYIVGELEKNT